MGVIKYSRLLLLFALTVSFLSLALAVDETYIPDLYFYTTKAVYAVNERIELRGYLFLTNYTNSTLVTGGNHTPAAGAVVSISLMNSSNVSITNLTLLTTAEGSFFTRNDYNTTTTLLSAPSTPGTYHLRVNYTDLNQTYWYTKTEIQVVQQTVDWLSVSSNKLSYDSGEPVTLLVEAVSYIGDRITYVANVSINGTLRNSTKGILSTFTCTTGDNGKCTVTTTAPTTYGYYFLEVNNFKGFGSFYVQQFQPIITMKDSLGKSLKNTFSTNDRAAVELSVPTNSTSETYAFRGIITDVTGRTITTINETILNSSNSYTSRFTFVLDSSYQPGTYYVEVNVTKSSGSVVSAGTSFQVRSWDFFFKKRDTQSGFEYEYSTFPNRTLNFEIYPSWRSNASTISDLNITSINVTLRDTLQNVLNTPVPSWNASCGAGGCYYFPLNSPGTAGEYYLFVTIAKNDDVQTITQRIYVATSTITAQSTDSEGTTKELFGTNEPVYITLHSTNNSGGGVNLSEATLISIFSMNGTELNYTRASNHSGVNGTNNINEWAWNSTSQRLKIDVPRSGGMYTFTIAGENNTLATTARVIVNPYEACIVPKTSAVTSGAMGTYYYAYQFKTTDSVYFEVKLLQANNPTGRANFANISNSSNYGMGRQCGDFSSTRQVINNATITITEVRNTNTGEVATLNTSSTACQADDTKGAYTCTLKPYTSWDPGSYAVAFMISSQDGQTTDIDYNYFEARAFYLYASANTWTNKPGANITFTAYMYEAGNNWWGNYGSGGMSGTVTVEKIEYQGREGEWLWPPIDYSYNTSLLNRTTITNGQGSFTLRANLTPGEQWKTGSYRAILKGTNNDGVSDYGYAWFNIKNWEVYASPVDCAGTSCTSAYQLASRSNISMYVTINNAGEWGTGGSSLGGAIAISVKKIQDCRKWPCTDLNTTQYNATRINVTTSSRWYWDGTTNISYIINLTPTTGSWGSGYYTAILDVNGTETGTGWFTTSAFYTEVQPTNENGTTWKYTTTNNAPAYFKITTVQRQKNGYSYGNYNASDYLNTTIVGLRVSSWDSATNTNKDYYYPSEVNLSIIGGGTTINGTRILNVTRTNGTWNTGYYWGELTLKDTNNETATAWLSFQVQPFRVEINPTSYTVADTNCVNATLNIRNPDWNDNSLKNGTYSIQSVTERTWTGNSNTITAYTNYTPSGNFTNGTTTLIVCPNDAQWGSGSWGGYHYLGIRVRDSTGASEEGWLSFQTQSFTVGIGTISGSIGKNSNVSVNITLSVPGGSGATGNLSRVYQWRWDNYNGREEAYNFTVGSCSSTTSASCTVTSNATIIVHVPSGGWQEGYNYLYTQWLKTNGERAAGGDAGFWFNSRDTYYGWFSNTDATGVWKYYFSPGENVTIRLYARNANDQSVNVNVTRVEYAVPTNNCWSEYCRTYTNASYTIVGKSTTQINDSGNILNIAVPSMNWTYGWMTVRATIQGPDGTVTVKDGSVYIKDTTPPTVNLTAPSFNATLKSPSFDINWTTTENATCSITLVNHDNFRSWYCNSYYNITSLQACNSSLFTGATYSYEYIYQQYHYWYKNNTWGWSSSTTGLTTGGFNHSYRYTPANLADQAYGIQVSCYDNDWNNAYAWSAVKLNLSTGRVNVTLTAPGNGSTLTSTPISLNYTLRGPDQANCTLYTNSTGSFVTNTSNIVQGNSTGRLHAFNYTPSVGKYVWNVYCADVEGSTNNAWSGQNRTFTLQTIG